MPNDRIVVRTEVELQSVLATDRPVDVFRFLSDAALGGYRCALVTLIEIIGGSSRALGTPMAVREDGLYCGYVSGGCVEAAVAREALDALAAGQDRICRYGQGSPYFDIVLPCGGGIVLAIHVVRDSRPISDLLTALEARQAVALTYDPRRQGLAMQSMAMQSMAPGVAQQVSGWQQGIFVSVYRPDPKIILSGHGLESGALVSLATAAGLEVCPVDSLDFPALPDQIDADTAIVLLHHDLDRELPILRAALGSPAFYIGCLGSRRTHTRRCEALRAEGVAPDLLDRIHGPIGLFGPARDARSVAVSVLAEVLSVVETRRRSAEPVSVGVAHG